MTKREKFPEVGPEAFTAVKRPQTGCSRGSHALGGRAGNYILFTPFTVHNAQCTLNSELCTVHYKLQTVHSAVLQCTGEPRPGLGRAQHCPTSSQPGIIHYLPVYYVHCVLQTVHCTLHCLVCTVHCIMYTVHYTV